MATFAQIDANNMVVAVYPAGDEWSGKEVELSSVCGVTLKQTSYNTRLGIHYGDDGKRDGVGFRGNFASIGFIYDPDLDAFISPNPGNSVLNPASFEWESNWVELPNGSFWLMLYKNASSSISSTILTEIYGIPTADFSNPNRSKLQMRGVPTGPAYVVVRDPVDRFLSAYSMGMYLVEGRSVPDFIDWMLAQNPLSIDLHFRPQTLVIGDVQNVTYFDFAKDLSALATALGLSGLPSLHVAPGEKPALTDDDLAKLQTFYADDIAMYAQVQAQTS
jgi:hypothetical protein